jgi:adenosyl cobinamide kinase/adenosyl cobinamide phosphate guanylyltransferase
VITLVLGGARSGKSEAAEAMAASSAAGEGVTYVATAIQGRDADLDGRIARHRARRPPEWETIEVCGRELPETLARLTGVVLVDGLGQWLATLDGPVPSGEVCQALRTREDHTVVVSDEVGLGVHPPSEAGRRFRDDLGALNQAVAGVADRAVLVVAGRLLALEPAS